MPGWWLQGERTLKTDVGGRIGRAWFVHVPAHIWMQTKNALFHATATLRYGSESQQWGEISQLAQLWLDKFRSVSLTSAISVLLGGLMMTATELHPLTKVN